MRELLIATGNPGKFREMRNALGEVPFDLKSLADESEDVRAEVEETAPTFEENAIMKAKTYAQRSGKLTLAEDSGLEVDALHGRPGVFTARYAPGSDQDRYRKLLKELQDVLDDKRTARFVASVAIYDPDSGKVRTCEGAYPGMIVREPRGSGGFGYDPVFFSTELKKTAAEMTIQEKNTVSHRGRALAKAREILLKEFI